MVMAGSRVTLREVNVNKSVVILKGKTRHGKNRIAQHGSKWFVEKVDKFRGQPAMFLRSENETFAIRGRGNSKQEWKTSWMHDNRWVLLKDDPNFIWS